MTYEETINRMVRLMFIKSQGRWVDVSLRNLVGDWLRRVEERYVLPSDTPFSHDLISNSLFLGCPTSLATKMASFPSCRAFLNSTSLLRSWSASMPGTLAPESRFWLPPTLATSWPSASDLAKSLCPSFQYSTPTLGSGLRRTPCGTQRTSRLSSTKTQEESVFCKDLLLFAIPSERMNVSVFEAATTVLTHTVMTAIGELLGNIEKSLISKVLETYYGGDESKIPTEEYLARTSQVSSTDLSSNYGIDLSTEDRADGGKTYIYDISKELPPHGDWLEMLAGPKPSWLRAFLTNVSIVQGPRKIPNQVSKVFTPRQNQRVKLHTNPSGQPLKVEVFGAIRSAT